MNNYPSRSFAPLAGLAGLVFLSATVVQAQIAFNGTYTQTFTENTNGVNAATAINAAGNYTWTDNSTVAGWFAVVSGTTAAQYHATNTNGNNGLPNALKLARASGTSGALGILRNSSNTGLTTFGVQLTNTTGSTIGNFDISYLGQQWQDNTGGIDTLTFQYSTDATSLSNGNWTTVGGLSFSSVENTNTGTNFVSLAPTGSSIAPGATVSGSISGLSLSNGSAIWFRWVDEDNTGIDDALTIDNFSITSSAAIPEPSAAAALAGLIGLASAVGLRSRRRDER